MTAVPHKLRILFYEDSPIYGGHQKLSLDGIRYACEAGAFECACVYYQGNRQFADELESIRNKNPHFKLLPISIASRSLQPLRTFFERRKVRELRAIFRHDAPDAVVVLQGRIESGTLALAAARAERLTTISYIPMAHPVGIATRHPWAALLRDRLNLRYYAMPDAFITISESTKRMLRDRGVRVPVSVVPNGVDPPTWTPSLRETTRQKLGVDDRFALIIAGRIDFLQKCQDFIIGTMQRFRSEFADVNVLFVGSGPDEKNLQHLIDEAGLSDHAKIVSWTDDMHSVYAAADLVVIPSKFEGVPLTMLEAMAAGIPVIGTAVDGMAEMLPSRSTFMYRDPTSFIKAVRHARGNDISEETERNRQTVLRENSLPLFQQRFVQAISDLVALRRPTGSPTATSA